jgi:hypothetical protein
MNPFDYINDASHTKKNLMRGSENDTLAEKDYNPWLTNIAFSQHPDTILHANLMNMYHHLDHRPQYEYFINSLRSKKRFGKWSKKKSNEDLDMICELYGVNRNVGKEYLALLTREQLDMIKQEQETGGIKNERHRKSGGGNTAE